MVQTLPGGANGIYGCPRVNTLHQDLTMKRAALGKPAAASFAPKRANHKLPVLLDVVAPCDTPVVTRVNRLARSTKDLQDMGNE